MGWAAAAHLAPDGAFHLWATVSIDISPLRGCVRHLVKTQTRIALFEPANATEWTCLFGQFFFVIVLDYEQAVLSESRASTCQFQGQRVISGIGRVEEK